jgi:hypothetical protein
MHFAAYDAVVHVSGVFYSPVWSGAPASFEASMDLCNLLYIGTICEGNHAMSEGSHGGEGCKVKDRSKDLSEDQARLVQAADGFVKDASSEG